MDKFSEVQLVWHCTYFSEFICSLSNSVAMQWIHPFLPKFLIYGGSDEYFWAVFALWCLSACLTFWAGMGRTTKPSAVGSLLRNSLITPSSLLLISSNNTASEHTYVRLSSVFGVAIVFCACDFTSTFPYNRGWKHTLHVNIERTWSIVFTFVVGILDEKCMLLSPSSSSSRAWSQLGAPSRLGSWVISTVILVPKYLSSACVSRLNWGLFRYALGKWFQSQLG